MDASARIDDWLKGLTGWQRDAAVQLRRLIHVAAPGIVEDWKWDTPVFTQRGNVCAIAGFRDHLKVNFFKGAALPDPAGLFNAGLEAKTSRAIDLHAGDALDEAAFRDLVAAAVAQNGGS